LIALTLYHLDFTPYGIVTISLNTLNLVKGCILLQFKNTPDEKEAIAIRLEEENERSLRFDVAGIYRLGHPKNPIFATSNHPFRAWFSRIGGGNDQQIQDGVLEPRQLSNLGHHNEQKEQKYDLLGDNSVANAQIPRSGSYSQLMPESPIQENPIQRSESKMQRSESKIRRSESKIPRSESKIPRSESKIPNVRNEEEKKRN